MVPTINVYVPEGMAAALERHKGQLNVSRVCAAALHEAILWLELREQGRHDTEALLARLRREKREELKSIRRLGREWAGEWARTASYTDLRRYGQEAAARLETMPRAEQDRYYADEFPLPKDVAEALQAQREEIREREGVFDRASFCEGWHARVREFWAEIKDKL